MLEKVLQPYTIIPDNLYIERDADRQIKDIVSHMQRPGYVLVSRQMGKTNLLIRAKRTLGNSNDRFVYIDLSSKSEKERDCFRNIIDTLLETNRDIKDNLYEIITANRSKNTDIEPSQEHLKELREILNFHKGKIVIMLDEIDALLNSSFSNNFFLHVRSIYFERENFEELKRLTYILSGVVIPSEIIRNGKISPFNIGDKIYLNDFSENEYHKLLEKAQLNTKLTKEICDYIYFWTSGNPRISFDVLNEIETNFVENKTIDKKLVDDVIRKLYLNQYDRPPIDHIRNLVQEDSDIRDAVIELHFSKGDKISIDIKNKLYLYGIINFFENEKVVIKNRIIKEALDYDWLMSIEDANPEILQKVILLSSKGDIEGAIKLIEDFLNSTKTTNIDKKIVNLLYFHLANSLYNTNKLDEAVNCYEKIEITNIETNDLKTYHLNYGEALFYLNKYNKAIEILEYFNNLNEKNIEYLKGIISLANSLIKSDEDSNRIRGVKYLKNLLKELNNPEIKYELIDALERKRIISIIHYNIGNAYYFSKENSIAENHFDEGIEVSLTENLPIFYLRKIIAKSNDIEKEKILSELYEFIINSGLEPKEFKAGDSPLTFTKSVWYDILYFSLKISQKIYFDFIEYSLSKIKTLNLTREGLIFEIALKANSKKDFATALDLLRPVIKTPKISPNESENLVYFSCLKLFCRSSTANENISEKSLYCQLIFESDNFEIDDIDFGIMGNLLLNYVTEKKTEKAKELIKNIRAIDMDESLKGNYLVIDYLEFRLYFESINKIKGKELGVDFLKKYNNSEEFKNLIIINDDQISNLKSDVERKIQILTPYVKSKVIERYQKVKVKYKDGKLVTNKFRKLELDINSGKCVVIEVFH